MAAPLTLAEAARALGTSPRNLRRWIGKGCPALQGGRGRGRGYRVDPAAVRAWRAASAPHVSGFSLQDLGRLALDFFRRGRDVHELGQRLIGIPDAKAAALLVLVLQYVALRLQLPAPDAELLEAIARQGLGNGHAMADSVPCSDRLPAKEPTCFDTKK
jgi:hypothetical protein